MNRVSISMSLSDFLSLVDPSIKSVEEIQDRIKKIAAKEPSGKTRRSLGRPILANNHPHHTQEELTHFKEILFTFERIDTHPEWVFQGKKPTRLATDQSDMDEDEVLLDNGQVAGMNSGLEEVPPMPKYRK